MINKIDRPDRRIDEVLDEVYDLFIDLDATEEQLDFPVLYTNAKAGIALTDPDGQGRDLVPLFEAILASIPAPIVRSGRAAPVSGHQPAPQRLRGPDRRRQGGERLAAAAARKWRCSRRTARPRKASLSVVYSYDGLNRVERDVVEAGDIAAVAGVDDIFIGDTLGDLADPRPLPVITVEEPTISMVFSVNTSPLAGKDGKYLTSRHIKERLDKELLYNVSIRVEQAENRDSFRVSARGELQLAVLVETMRREGFELSLSKPKVITREVDGQLLRADGAGRGGCPGEVHRDRHGDAEHPARPDDQDGQQRLRARAPGIRDPLARSDRLPQPVPDRHPRHGHPEHAAHRLQALRRGDRRPAQRRAGLRPRRQGGDLRHLPPAAARHHLRQPRRPGLHRA